MREWMKGSIGEEVLRASRGESASFGRPDCSQSESENSWRGLRKAVDGDGDAFCEGICGVESRRCGGTTGRGVATGISALLLE